MKIEIVEEPIRFHLYGIGGTVESGNFGEVGFRFMNEMWRVLRSNEIPTTGVNHWVYLPGGRMFTGVELKSIKQPSIPEPLEPLEFEMQRYMKHLHVGPYQALPQKWQQLKTELADRDEIIGSHSLEIYGHHCDDTTKLETAILIELKKKSL